MEEISTNSIREVFGDWCRGGRIDSIDIRSCTCIYSEPDKIYGCDGVFKRKWSLHESCSKGYIAVPIGKQVRDGIFYGGDAIECIPIDDASNQKSNLRIIINTEDSTIVNIRLDLVRDDGLFFEDYHGEELQQLLSSLNSENEEQNLRAEILLTPDANEVSDIILNRPISPVLFT